ncbi:bifunctional protein biotin operon repressor/biotin--[acetyl-CoA-carboxylase] synthetase BirA [Thermoclostridium stercorarium subsp. stercorarium DSM 8532]|uniref:Bifunctional ligase/repressor BirA n=1 Tax=Thermoclostridium stercorarium (strain ATCC 35414 / DSM 8532 / NCIMB 11754) TaxID=1121335 RepID=L7VSS3_THES1|nr:biotin--[acetyl-CoA-carboxylase] ligase [Thermoclostridium stercorarium]AGC69624.1 bifunctional protein biotin operon repressor/biotin--[acetyl-CoA-carboxylase] synthetase BirA [Thermoclostridium stercorarium subsp. stercorarium DSM 8532]AGI40576.1 BirA [Thermoclostridium stercorarium subsp. stercorarium DSM 8532]
MKGGERDLNTKDRILKMLAENKGRFISGEQISEELGISRTAVWKHILKLREEGHRIQSVNRLGYQLVNSGDVYDRGTILSRLNTKILGKNLYFYETIDSTNNELKKMAAEGACEGTVVIALCQTEGRGRRGRRWQSDAGSGIYMSVLLKPDLPPTAVQSITLLASSAVCKVLEKYVKSGLGIKWPNDILINNKKVCGILTEMTSEPDKVQAIILGIGLNVWNREEDFGDELKHTATSLCLNTDREISRTQLVVEILKELEDLYLNFVEKGSSAKFMDIWRCFSVTIGRDIIVIQGENRWQAKALDVLDDGRLLVETPDGKRQTVLSGEISIRSCDN